MFGKILIITLGFLFACYNNAFCGNPIANGVVEGAVSSAEDVENVPAGTISSTNVQDAINEIDTDLQGKVTAEADSVPITIGVDVGDRFSINTDHFVVSGDTGSAGFGVYTPTSRVHLPQESDAATPTMAYGDGDTGIYEQADDVLALSVKGGARQIFFNQSDLYVINSLLIKLNAVTSNTQPLYSFINDNNTGINRSDSDQLVIITGGEGVLTANSDYVSLTPTTNLGIGTSTFGANATTTVAIADGLSPTTAISGQIELFSSAGELYVQDDQNNVTLLSPHAEDYPEEILPSSKYPAVSRDQNSILGLKRWIAIGKLAEIMQEMAHDWGYLPLDKKIIAYQDIEKISWDSMEEATYQNINEEIQQKTIQKSSLIVALSTEEDNATKEEIQNKIDSISIPKQYKKRPIPDWINERLPK